MIRSLKAIPFRFLISNKFITISSIVSIMLSVCLILSMFHLTTGARKYIEQNDLKTYGDVDIVASYNPESNKILDNDLVNKITSIKNIEAASKVLQGTITLSGKSVYSVGIDNDYIAKSKYKYKKDIKQNDIIVNSSLAETMNLKVGDSVKLNNESFTITEICNYSEDGKIFPDMILVNRQTLKKLLNSKSDTTCVMIKTKNKRYNSEIIQQIQQIDRELNANIAENDPDAIDNLQALDAFNRVLSVLVLAMSGLFILGTFQTFLHNYRRQFAVIRSIGGSSQQAFGIVFLQCTCINFLGVLMGVILSAVVNKFLIGAVSKLFLINNVKIDFSLPLSLKTSIISFLVLEVLMLIPAFKSRKILPMKVSSKNEEIDYGNKKFSNRLIKIIGCAAILFIAYGFAIGHDIFFGLIGMVFMTIAVYLSFPHYSKQILNSLSVPLKYIGGNVSYVAIKNLIPQVRKNTVIILSISTMVMIASFCGSAFNTIKGTNEQICRDKYISDIVVTSKNQFNTTLGYNVKQDIDKLSGVKDSAELSSNDSIVFANKSGEKQYILRRRNRPWKIAGSCIS